MQLLGQNLLSNACIVFLVVAIVVDHEIAGNSFYRPQPFLDEHELVVVAHFKHSVHQEHGFFDYCVLLLDDLGVVDNRFKILQNTDDQVLVPVTFPVQLVCAILVNDFSRFRLWDHLIDWSSSLERLHPLHRAHRLEQRMVCFQETTEQELGIDLSLNFVREL